MAKSTKWFDFVARYSGTDGMQSLSMTFSKAHVRGEVAVWITTAKLGAAMPGKKKTGRRARIMRNDTAVVTLLTGTLIRKASNVEGEGCWETRAFIENSR